MGIRLIPVGGQSRAESAGHSLYLFSDLGVVVLVVIRLEEGVHDVVKRVPVRRRGMSIKVLLAFPVLDQGVAVLVVGVLPQLV